MPRRAGQNPVYANWAYLYAHQTKPEEAFERALARLGVRYRFQHLVVRYILDFALPDHMVAIEVDGKSHDSKAARAKDEERTEFLMARGWRVVRIKNDDVVANPIAAVNKCMIAAGLPYRAGAD